MKQKRILIFSLAYTPFVGGAELAVKHITDRLDPDEWVFDMVTLRFDRRLPKRERVGNITVYRLGFSLSGAAIADTFHLPLSLNKYWFPFAAAWRAFWLHRTLHYEAVWSIMANYAGFGAFFFKLFHRDVPLILTLQEGDPIEHIMRRVGILRPLFRQLFICANVVQAISRFLADFGQSMGALADRTIVIPNGVDYRALSTKQGVSDLARARKEMGKKRRDTLIITTSRLVPKNAIDVIIRSLAFLPVDVKLAVLGDGPERNALLKLVRELRLAHRVVFLSAVPHEALPAFLQAADVFVRPSRSEGLGSSFLEAMAAGIPVVATAVGGIPDFLEDGVTGLVCEVDNPKSVAEKVALLRDRELRTRIVKNARAMVAERYDWGSIARRMEREVFAHVAVS